uniref:Uncharacterized protein n=1 Tax=Arundo donax TaxID=35708 RepID=A0A0A9HB14_ARUDO
MLSNFYFTSIWSFNKPNGSMLFKLYQNYTIG